MQPPLLLLLTSLCLFCACDPKADDSGDGEGDLPIDLGDDTGEPDTGTEPAPADLDQDGDGYTPRDGDCDDAAASTHPEAIDGCDGLDQDCDGAVDEDFAGDAYEGEELYLGELTGDGVAEQEGYLLSASDEDVYTFYTVDGDWDVWEVDVTLSAPEGVDVGLRLYQLQDEVWELRAEVDAAGAGGAESYTEEGDWVGDDTGTYVIEVWSVDGASSCSSPYRLHVQG